MKHLTEDQNELLLQNAAIEVENILMSAVAHARDLAKRNFAGKSGRPIHAAYTLLVSDMLKEVTKFIDNSQSTDSQNASKW